MFGTNTAGIERKAFRIDLSQHLDAEAASVRRYELIEEEALYLVQEGQKFHPWTFKHFTEAIENAPRGDRIAMFASIASAVDLQLNNQYSNHMALAAIQQLVERYWLDCALKEVEKN